MNYEKIYKKNLEILEKYSNQLFKKVVEQDISNLELIMNNDLSHNIKVNEEIIYPKNTKKAIEEQVFYFFDNPGTFYYKPISFEDKDEVSKFTNKIVNNILSTSYLINRDDEGIFKSYHAPKNVIPYLIVFGIGTGEYLQQILSQKKVLNLVIVDKDYSFMKLSMHLIDWKPILDKFIQRPNSFIVMTGDTSDTLAYEIINHIYAHNSMYTFYTQYFTHISNSFFMDIKNTISKNMFHAINGWGFFEDERISLQHTLVNLKNSSRIYNPKKPMNTEVLIIGSGPSLDEDIEKIKEVENNVFIISCGTALRTLWKHNIYPDLHIEIERNISTFNALRYIDRDYLKKIILLGLNVLHPNVKKLFKECYLIARDNDAGSSLLQKTIPLEFTNPTVVNCGINLAFSLQFKNIYLLGVDNGFKNPEIHHSKNNIHSDKEIVDFKFKIKNMDYLKDKIQGNFGEDVFTNSVFAWSKQRIENCIYSFQKKNFEVFVYNCSDGAFIKNTIPNKFNTNNFSNKIKNKKELFDNFELLDVDNYSKYIASDLEKHRVVFEKTINEINRYLENYKIKCAEDIYLILDDTYQIINKIKNESQVTFSFLSGSTKIIYSLIYSHSLLYFNVKEEDKVKFIKECVKNISLFINYSYKAYLKIINNKNNYM